MYSVATSPAYAEEARPAPTLLRSAAFVGGEWVTAASGSTFQVTNPINGEVIAAVPDMDAEDAREGRQTR